MEGSGSGNMAETLLERLATRKELSSAKKNGPPAVDAATLPPVLRSNARLKLLQNVPRSSMVVGMFRRFHAD